MQKAEKPWYCASWVSRPHFWDNTWPGVVSHFCIALICFVELFQQLWFFKKFEWCVNSSFLHHPATLSCSLFSISLSFSLNQIQKISSFWVFATILIYSRLPIQYQWYTENFFSEPLFISGLFCLVICRGCSFNSSQYLWGNIICFCIAILESLGSRDKYTCAQQKDNSPRSVLSWSSMLRIFWSSTSQMSG